MKTWDVFTTADQLRNAIRALLNPGDATATNTYLGFGTDNLPVWNRLPTATQAATATDPIPNALIAKAWVSWLGTATGTSGFLVGQNVSSVNRTIAGKWTVNFSTGAAASVYAGEITIAQSVGNTLFAGQMATGSQLATSFDVIAVTAAGNATDAPILHGVFYW